MRVQYAYLHVMITRACVLYLQMLRVYLCIPACTRVYSVYTCVYMRVLLNFSLNGTVHALVVTRLLQPGTAVQCTCTCALYSGTCTCTRLHMYKDKMYLYMYIVCTGVCDIFCIL